MVFVQKAKRLHHPRVESIARMPRHLANDVQPILEPLQLAASRYGEDRGRAVFAVIAVTRYDFAIESETRFSVVWKIVVEVPVTPLLWRCVTYSSTEVGTDRLES